MPTRRQELLGLLDTALLRPGPDESYADGDDTTWQSVDWPSMTRRVPVLGRSVNVVDTGGDGPVLVLVHGLSGAWQNWLYTIPAFMGSHRVIAPDLPGFGGSDLPAGDVSIRGYAKVLDALLDELGVESADVVGNSMGGFVAAELTISFATRVRRLVLVSAAGLSIEYRRKEPLLAGARVWLAAASYGSANSRMVITRPRARRAALQIVARYPEKLTPAIAAEMVRGTGTPGFIPALEALVNYSFRDKLVQIEVPVLVVWGRNDMLVPSADAREFVDLIGPNARREMFDDTGHVAMIERPTRFNALLAGFLAEEPAAVSA